jgi:hypothetical protein
LKAQVQGLVGCLLNKIGFLGTRDEYKSFKAVTMSFSFVELLLNEFVIRETINVG